LHLHRNKLDMKILGLVGSYRKLGNTEILVKEALSAARECGADASLLRLTDLDIQPCRGCMACVFKNEPCAVPDDAQFLFDNLRQYDAIILGAPTYFLGPAAIIKLIIDRLLMLAPEDLDGRPAATIAVAGRPGWLGLSGPMLNVLPLAAGYRLVDSMSAFSPGPGEIALDESALARSRDLGRRVCSPEIAGTTQVQNADTASCPVCWNTAFQLSASGRLECPVCRTAGALEVSENGISVVFDEDGIADNRFTLAERQDHMRNWILASKDSFQSHLRDVLRARKPYHNDRIHWTDIP
jgi:hypothetical protein